MSVHWNGKYLGACTQSPRLFIFIIVIYAYIRYSGELEYSTILGCLYRYVVFVLILFRRCVCLVEALFIHLFLRLFILREFHACFALLSTEVLLT